MHFQPLLNCPNCGCHIASHAAQGGLQGEAAPPRWQESQVMIAARTPWRGCHVALGCQEHSLLACNHKKPQSVNMSCSSSRHEPTLQISKSLSQKEVMHAKIQKTEKHHTSPSWSALFLSYGFKGWDRQEGEGFFRSSGKFHLWERDTNSHLQTWPLSRSTSLLGNSCQADWRPNCPLADMGVLLSSKTDSKTPLNSKSLWQDKLSKYNF